MKKKIGDLTINELLNYSKNCIERDCEKCSLYNSQCGIVSYNLGYILEIVGEDTLIEVEDE